MIIVNAKLETNSSNISKIKSEVELIEKETLLEEKLVDATTFLLNISSL